MSVLKFDLGALQKQRMHLESLLSYISFGGAVKMGIVNFIGMMSTASN